MEISGLQWGGGFPKVTAMGRERKGSSILSLENLVWNQSAILIYEERKQTQKLKQGT